MNYQEATLAFYRSIKSIPAEGSDKINCPTLIQTCGGEKCAAWRQFPLASDDKMASKGSFHGFGYCGMVPRPIMIVRE